MDIEASLKLRSVASALAAAWSSGERPSGMSVPPSEDATVDVRRTAAAMLAASAIVLGLGRVTRGALRRLLLPEKPLAALAVLFVAFAVSGLSGCQRSNATRAEDRPLELIVIADAETLDPRYVTDPVGMRVSRLIHAGLVRLDPDTLAPVPYLARAWEWKDDRTLEVSLRDGVFFHSGAPFTSEDVVATLRAFASPEVASRHASVVDAIESARALDGLTVVITLRRPHATLLTDLELPILRRDQAFAPPDPEGALDGLGPYVVEHIAQGEIRLTPATGSALPRPLHAAVVRTVHDENARALRLYAGRADIAVNVLSPTLLPAIESNEGLAVTSRPGANLTYMVIRMGRAPLDDVHLRRAISSAIDRRAIARTFLAGRAQPADTIMPPGHWAYVAASSPLAFDPDSARRELADAGLSNVHLSLLTSTDRLRMSIARFIAQELLDVGVTVDVTPLELGTMLARLNAGDFDLATLQLPELTEPNVLRVFLDSASIPPEGANRGRVRDAELDRLLDLGDRVRGDEARRSVYADVERLLREQLFIVPLWHEDQVAVTSARARGFLPSREGRWLSLAGL
jgi:peptide/nickel transport system substrate-binding protein